MSESLIDGAAEAPAESDATSRDYVIESDVTSQTDRPEWLPEKYSTGEDLAKAYKELESKLGNKEEDIKSKLMEEIQTEAFSSRPESAGDYELPEMKMVSLKRSFSKGLRCMLRPCPAMKVPILRQRLKS